MLTDSTLQTTPDKLIVNTNETIYLQTTIQFDKNETLANIEFVDNENVCKAKVDVSCRWSLNQGQDWSLWKPLVHSIADFNDFALSYCNEDFIVTIQFKLDIDWQQNWKQDQINEQAYVLEDVKINDTPIDEIECLRTELAPEKHNILQKSEDKLWKPYEKMELPVHMWQQMMQAVNKQIGHIVIWFSHDSTIEHKVSALRSFDLLHQGAVKFLQVMVVDNNFNTQKSTYDAFDIDFEQGIEIHILPDLYEQVFGQGKEPGQHDYFYAPVANRMFEVTNVEAQIGLMNAIGWHVCHCKSYEIRHDLIDKSTSQVDDKVASMLADHDIFDIDALAKPMTEFDAKDSTKEQVTMAALNMFVTNTHIDLSMFDSSRKWIHHAIIAKADKTLIENDTVPVSAGLYDMSKAVYGEVAVQYIPELPDIEYTFCMWFRLNHENRYQKTKYKQLAKVGDMMIAINDGKLLILDACETNVSKLNHPYLYFTKDIVYLTPMNQFTDTQGVKSNVNWHVTNGTSNSNKETSTPGNAPDSNLLGPYLEFEKSQLNLSKANQYTEEQYVKSNVSWSADELPDSDKPSLLRNVVSTYMTSDTDITDDTWYQIVLRVKNCECVKNLYRVHFVVELCKLQDCNGISKVVKIESQDMYMLYSMNLDKTVQLYTFNGSVTHVRIDSSFDITLRKLLCFERPYESTILADDATQIEVDGRQLVNGLGEWLVKDLNLEKAISASSDWSATLTDAYLKLRHKQLWLYESNNWTAYQYVESNTKWKASQVI